MITASVIKDLRPVFPYIYKTVVSMIKIPVINGFKKTVRDHLFSRHAKFSEKPIFLTS